MYLTRQEYDGLVRCYPLWMRRVWPKLRRQWWVEGVRVADPPAELRRMVASLKVVV